MKVTPAINTVPVRAASLVSAIASCTVPFPEPLAPDEIPIQAALVVAFQVQPPGAVTLTLVLAPPLPMFVLVGVIEYEQPASCVNVNVWSPAVIVPRRWDPVFAAAA